MNFTEKRSGKGSLSLRVFPGSSPPPQRCDKKMHAINRPDGTVSRPLRSRVALERQRRMTISLINSQIKSQRHSYFITEELTANSKRTGTHVLKHATHDGFLRKACSGGLMMDDKNKAMLCRNLEKKKPECNMLYH